MPISTCLSTGRPTIAIHGDMLYETDTMRLIIYDTSQGVGNERWVFHDQNGFQFGTISESDLINYDGGILTPDVSSPYYMGAGINPTVHVDARYFDGLDSTNNPTPGVKVASWTNKANPGLTLTQASSTAQPTYEVDGTDRLIRGRNYSTGTWDMNAPYSWGSGDYTSIQVVKYNPNLPSAILQFPMYVASYVEGQLRYSGSGGHMGAPSIGVPAGTTFHSTAAGGNPYNGTSASWYANGYSFTYDRNGGNTLFSDPSYTELEQNAAIRDVFNATGSNKPQLWILRREGSTVQWFINGAWKMAEKTGVTNITSSTTGFAPGGDLYEYIRFPSALSTANLNRIVNYATATYDIGEESVPKLF